MYHDDQRLIFIPFGGLGAIGCNCSVFSYGGSSVMIDCGLMFPDESLPGVDYVLPDLERLEDELDHVEAIVLTHGHEDHIGALPYLLERSTRKAPLPLMGTPFTLGLVRRKLAEHDLPEERFPLVEIGQDAPLTLGAFTLSWCRMPHSIPMAVLTVLETALGRVVVTGDFRLSDTRGVSYEEVVARLGAIGDAGVLALLSDSTNIEAGGRSRHSDDLVDDLDTIISECEGRVLVSLFSSNIHRVVTLWEIARRTKRRVAIIGRSLWTYLEVAAGAGLVPFQLNELLKASEIDRLPDEEVMVLLTGSQAEDRSALKRASVQDHPHLKIKQDDVVILSSRLIPGNEQGIYRMINGLTRLGAKVLYDRTAPVHTSGHGHREELEEMIDLLRPRTFVPIHGEHIFLQKHAEMARRAGIPDVHLIDTGEPLAIGPDGAEPLEPETLNPFVVQGTQVVTMDQCEARKRLFMSYHGLVAVTVVVERRSGLVEAEARIALYGVADADGYHSEALCYRIEDELGSLTGDASAVEMEAIARRLAKRYCKRNLGRRPELHVEIIEP